MTVYALRLANGQDTAVRMRAGDTLPMTTGGTPLQARPGLRPDGGGVVSVAEGSMAVEVSPFMAWLPGSLEAQRGFPFVSDDTVTLTLAAGDGSQDRVDTVVARVYEDVYDGSGQTTATVEVVTGTPGAGAPPLPAGAVPLRDVTVPAGVSAGTGGLSASHLGADRRTYTAALGGVLRVANATQRDLLDPFPGQMVWNDAAGRHEWWDGDGWRWRGDRAARVRLRRTSNYQNAAGYQELPWQTAVKHVHDGDPLWTNGARVRIPADGAYALSAHLQFAGTSSAPWVAAIVSTVREGVVAYDGGSAPINNAGNNRSATTTVWLERGDEVSVTVYTQESLAVQPDASASGGLTEFSVVQLSH